MRIEIEMSRVSFDQEAAVLASWREGVGEHVDRWEPIAALGAGRTIGRWEGSAG